MVLLKLLNVVFVALLLVSMAESYCIPCSGTGQINVNSFLDCNCQLPNIFHDSNKNVCVPYSGCPSDDVDTDKLLPEISNSSPKFHQLLNSLMDMFGQEKKAYPEDVRHIVEAIVGRATEVQNRLPELLRDVLAPLIVKNKDLASDCRFDRSCMLQKLLARSENVDFLAPRLPHILDEVGNVMSKSFDDVANGTKQTCGEDFAHCPWVKSFLGLRQVLDQLPSSGDNALRRVVREAPVTNGTTQGDEKKKHVAPNVWENVDTDIKTAFNRTEDVVEHVVNQYITKMLENLPFRKKDH